MLSRVPDPTKSCGPKDLLRAHYGNREFEDFLYRFRVVVSSFLMGSDACRERPMLPVLVSVWLIAVGGVLAQQAPFIEPATDIQLSSQQSQALATIRGLRSTEKATVVRVNPKALTAGDQILVPLYSSQPVEIRNNSRDFRSESSMSWIGTAPNA